MKFQIYQIENGPFLENAWIICNSISKKAFIIDAGDEPDKISGVIKKNALVPVKILATHGHLDHIGAVYKLSRMYKIPFLIHQQDEFLVKELPNMQKMFGMSPSPVPAISGYITDNIELTMDEVNVDVIETPGHSLGGVCYKIDNHVFVGDTLFNNSIGRTDLPGGNYTTLISSIREKLFSLPDETFVHCGHGPDTTIGFEKQNNPFLQ